MQAEWAPVEDRVRRLEVVEEEILRTTDVGTLASSQPWIEASSDLVVAAFGTNESLAFFFSRSEDQFLGLAGSTYHLIGNVRPANAVGGFSHLHALLNAIEEIIAPNVDSGHAKPDLPGLRPPIPWDGRGRLRHSARRFDRWPKQRAHFLARRLTTDELGPTGKRYTLASPLYIALEDVSEPASTPDR